MFQGKILVQGVGRAEKEPLNLFDPKSVQIQWELNQTHSSALSSKMSTPYRLVIANTEYRS